MIKPSLKYYINMNSIDYITRIKYVNILFNM